MLHWRRGWVVVIVGALLAALTGAAGATEVARPKRFDAGEGLADSARLEARFIGTAHAREHLAAALAPASTPATPLPVPNTAPSAIGAWSAPFTPASDAITGIHAVLLDTGKVLLYGLKTVTNPNGSLYEIQTAAEVFDPLTRTSRRVDPPSDDSLFCGAATVLGDGTVLVLGGLDPTHGWSSRGTAVVLTFDPVSETWTELPPMHAGRWYPSLVTLADGTGLTIGGRDANALPNPDVERIAPFGALAPQVVAQLPLDSQQGLYPKEYLLPDGRVFSYEGTRTDFLDPSTWHISPGPLPLASQFSYPNSVILPLSQTSDFKVAIYGGKNQFDGINNKTGTVLSTSVGIDLSSPTPTFSHLHDLPQPRTHMNSVLLPDGTVAMVGGVGAGQTDLYYLQSMLWNPASDNWSPMASQRLRRAYHSSAVLLPDGRVLSAGDNNPGGGGSALEIYSPPYLFKGARPSILSAPATARPGDSMAITTDVDVAQAVLIASGATTHATDNHQRMIRLAITPDAAGSGVVATIPDNGYVPQGPYMFFVLDAHGVPSTATWVQIVQPTADSTTTLSATPATSTKGTAIKLRATVAGTVPFAPSGTVTFTIDGIRGAPIALVNGVASRTLKVPAAGTAIGSHSVSARYNGDVHYAPSTSARKTYKITA
jgi:hypothetical protein